MTAYLHGDNGVIFPDGSVMESASKLGFRNKIINGEMDIAQRGTSFAAIASGAYSLDRWSFANTTTAVGTITQQADGPNTEFSNSIRYTVTTADAAIAAGDLTVIRQYIEGYNVRELIGGPFTLSFWVKSSKAGTYCVAFRNQDTADRSYVAEYSISAINTWEKKTITVSSGIPGTGTWNFTNGQGLNVSWALVSGTTNQTTKNAWQTGNFHASALQNNTTLDTIGNVFALTGVQLETGSNATPFEHRPFGLELALCQRYYIEKQSVVTATGQYTISFHLPVEMRSAPTVGTLTFDSGTGATFGIIGSSKTGLFQATNHSITATATKIPLSAEL